MSALFPWFERAFPGGYPASLFPNLLSRLRGALPRAKAEAEAVPADLRTEALDGAWSVHVNIGHLTNVESLWWSRLDDFDRGVQVLTPADVTNRRTHEADHDSRSLEHVLGGFGSARGRLIERVQCWSADALERTAQHPRLEQPMRAIDLLLFVAEHDDHHMARIAELRDAFVARSSRA